MYIVIELKYEPGSLDYFPFDGPVASNIFGEGSFRFRLQPPGKQGKSGGPFGRRSERI
jgi:hypothetical protein